MSTDYETIDIHGRYLLVRVESNVPGALHYAALDATDPDIDVAHWEATLEGLRAWIATTRPLADALEDAIAAAEIAEAAYQDHPDDGSAEDARLLAASTAADAAVDAARRALADSDELREWRVIEDGIEIEEVEAGSADDAIAIASLGVDRANYDDDVVGTGTIYVDLRVICDATGEGLSGGRRRRRCASRS